MEKSESDEEVEKKQKVMVEETGDPSMEESVVVRAEDGEERLLNVPFVRLFHFLEENIKEVTKVTRHGERVVLVEMASKEASLCLQKLKSLCGCTVTVTPHGVL
jgi:hypothetical protein